MSSASGVDRGLARLLRPFAKVEPEEAVTAVLMTLTVFLLLCAYYLLKIAREPLILLHGGAEVKSYAAAGQALLLIGVVRIYSEVAHRVGRTKLLAIVYLFFASNLLVFAALLGTKVHVAVAFFLWVGVFNYTAIAQFWAFAADTHSADQGKRLFAIFGIGSSVGAVAGARLAKALIGLGPQGLMLTAAGIIVLCVALLVWCDGRLRASSQTRNASPEEPVSRQGPFELLFRDKYLLLVAALTLLLNWVNSGGEYILDRTLLASAGAHGEQATAFIGAFKADYFGWVNLVGVLMQLFAVSRILAQYGVRNALLLLPLVSLVGYGLVIVAPVLALIRLAKIAENSLDYSIQNTARQALYLVTSRVEKYVGKTLVDTVMVRLGDVFSAAIVWAGTRVAVPTRAFATLNVVLVVAWVAIVFAVGREYDRRSDEGEELVSAEPAPS